MVQCSAAMECWVHTVSAAAPLSLALPPQSCAEDAVLVACRKLGVAPIARTLYALRPRGSRLFLPDAAEVQPRAEYELRIRFKVPKLRHLRSLDETTYDYYFRQARNDVVENAVPEIQYELHKKELLGLGIADMYRAIQEDNVSLRDVERKYKKYIPKEIIRKHQMFAKKPVHTTLQQWCQKTPRQDPNYIKERYLQQLMMMAPNYLSEEYAVRHDRGGGDYAPARVQVIPYHQAQPGIRLYSELDKEWSHVCTMEQLCFLGRKASRTELEVCRKNGVPVYLRFGSREEVASFISACDGYYRLMVKWTFNLSKDDPTPSLERLYAMKCHGPVGGEFSYHKLSEKRAKKHGCYVLRECQHDYDVYYIDACTKNSTTETYKVEYKPEEKRVEKEVQDMCYVFNSDESRPHASMEHLVRSFSDPDARVYLKECLPPSEYDKSQLLLCGEQHKVGVRIDQAQLQELLKHQRSPRCINTRDLQIFKGKEGVTKPIYVAELDDLGALVKLNNSTFSYYSVTGTDVMWEFPSCDDELVCEEHTTHLPDFVTRWPIRQINLVYDLQLHVRSFHSALICLTLDPYHDYPRVIITLYSKKNTTRVEYQTDQTRSVILSEQTQEEVFSFFEWAVIHVTMFAQELQILRKVGSQMETVLIARHEVMSSLRWFAVGSEYSAARWALYCEPREVPAAFPPECAVTANEIGYAGTQAVTSAGAWCYTTDANVTKDLCDVRDCALEETNIVLTKRGGALRYIYILPEWKYTGSQVMGAEGVTATFKAIWKLEENKKMEVALKTLVREKTDSHLKDFIELASKWAGVQSSSVVRLYGVTLMSPSALVMEYLQYGPLDVYLSENSSRLRPLQLMTAAAGLARALWDLSEAGCVHGRLRCSKVLLAQHDRDKLTVKLSDPGLHTYTEDDIHWIPVELFGDMSLARRSAAADVWAFGTTLWELFSYGLAPTQTNPVLWRKGYEQGHRLACPSQCPRDVWTVILDCWLADPHRRAIPQVIMRDISHLLHQEFIPTHDHYERVDPEVGAFVGNGVETVSPDLMFRSTSEADNTSDTSRVTADSSLSFPSTSVITIPEHDASTESLYPYENYSICEPDVHSMQWVVGLGPNCRVTTQQRIGSGNYGEVHRGVLERDDQVQARQVAIKRLKGNSGGDMRHDFLTEIEVMKTLEHPNIVEILGVCEERELLIVMEYLEHGALSSYLKFNKHRLTHRHLLKYAQDIASGMEYLSAKRLVHRDLAARNILVQDERHVKISDFGLARVTTDNDKYRMKTWRDLPLNWYAPEAATQGEFSHASDVWSYGVTLWEMFTYGANVPTFDLKRVESRAQCFTMPEDCPSEVYRRLMSPCWQYEPVERPTFLVLVQLCKQLLLQY